MNLTFKLALVFFYCLPYLVKSGIYSRINRNWQQ